MFLVALDLADNSLAYGSYLGGSKDDGGCIVIDGEGALFAVGDTNSDDFPTGSAPAAPRKDQDNFIAKLVPVPR